MRRRGRHALTLLLVAALSAALAAGVLGLLGPRSGGPADPPDRATLGSASVDELQSCAEVLLVGVDGAGEDPREGAPLGRTTDVVHRVLLRRATAAGRAVQVVRVDTGGQAAGRLLSRPRVPDVLRDLAGRPARARARAWRAPVPDAAAQVGAALQEAAAACPEQQVVLVGHAQGAAAVRQALLAQHARPEGLARVAGAVLVSDPDRSTRSGLVRVGAPAARPADGVATRLVRRAPRLPAATPTYAVWDVCSTADLVCDPRHTSGPDALGVRRSYAYGPGARALRGAAGELWARVLLRPVPRPEVRLAAATVGMSLELDLEVGVAPQAAAGVTWTGAEQLPDGVTLSEDGLLSGRPEQAGTWTIGYQVQGTAPATTPASGVVVLTVADSAGSATSGGQVSCTVRADTSAWCWGRGNHGQLGHGRAAPSTTPVQVTGTGWEQVSTSGATSCGVRTDGTLWCWGLDNFGQLGIGRGAPRTSPVQVGASKAWATVSTSWFHTCALRSSGALWCWGQNRYGQVGDGSTQTRPRPTRVPGTWGSVTTGQGHTCATRDDGSAWCWGQGGFGQLGDGAAAARTVPTRVLGDQVWSRLSAGSAHTCGITVSGSAACWGQGAAGQLGNGSRAQRRTPEPVSGDRTWTTISAGDASTCGVDDAGAAWCWGTARYGRLGDGRSNGSSLAPATVGGRWASLDAGWFHVCGTQADGTTACWGENEAGQVGDGSTQDRPRPEEVG